MTIKTNQPTGLNLFSTSQSFLTDLSPEAESIVKGGKRSRSRRSRSRRSRSRRSRT